MLGPGHILDLFCMLRIDTAWFANPCLFGLTEKFRVTGVGLGSVRV